MDHQYSGEGEDRFQGSEQSATNSEASFSQRSVGESVAGQHSPESEGSDDAPSEFPERISLRHLLTLVTNNNPNVLRAFLGGESPQSNEELVQYLKRNGSISSKKVEHAFQVLPRDLFVPENQKSQAFDNYPLRVEELGFNISAPEMYAVALEHLKIEEGDRILDIGCGSGHLTCLLAFMAGGSGLVRGIELSREIAEHCRKNVELARFSRPEFAQNAAEIEIIVSNVFFLEEEIHTNAYNRVYCGATCPVAYLNDIVKLLQPGGLMICPIGDKLYVIKRKESSTDSVQYSKEAVADVRFGNLVIPSKYDILRERYRKRMSSRFQLQQPISSFESALGFQDVESLFMSSERSDISLLVLDDSNSCNETIEIPSHKFVLSARSGHFRALFQSQMKDSKNTTVHIPTEFPWSVFRECLRYIYTDKAYIDNNNCIQALECSRFYDIPEGFSYLCEEQLRKRALAAPNDVAYVLAIAHHYAYDRQLERDRP
ncbi:protein-L-isoaspartate(D-aspartate) O-methyltransferase [Galdieria sulphuraria]|uniref:Protein-L-isoaspartate(D-aspartate) O-methyltransferase n=1 Tax=Galdieria sulphuraria TaxID=130081 RepID=M2XQD9_GALSU|nr:protein-L-isoaspartate(D-aspartate) O-methyltransferase [Galdieria sulphuraria]EME32432.1 protein-L-isoaspartate(D-aspartate) O-methyltransferase [Galdieria sulphuraria]|eukprot:XP_005708952.1 protein-L-isoaspartate(D-aspartate) O-methyltransferase [Galdieria sulphuraria]